MQTYFYKAIKKSGKIYRGSFDAKNEDDLIKKLRKEGGALISFKNKKDFSLVLRKFSIFNSVKAQDIIVFSRNLGAMIGAGLSVSKALETLEKQFKNPKFKKIIKEINFNIKKGQTINESVAKYPNVFSPLFISMVRAGEESGKISDSLAILSHQMENSNTLRKKIKGAMIYPTIVVIAMMIIGVLMLMFIVPTLQATFADLDTELPFSTQLVISFSDFLINNTLLFLILVFLSTSSFLFGIKTKIGKKIIDFILLKIPVISTIVKEINSARMSRTLSSLLSSGVDVVASFNITKDVLQNHYYKETFDKAVKNIEKGVPVAEVFVKNEKLYPPIVGAMVEVGEETGKLPEMLLNIADFYEGEVSQKTKDMSTIVEPLLMIIIGIAVGFFAISMITPMYSLMSEI